MLSFLSSTSCSISFLRSSWLIAVESNASLTNSDTPGLVDISSSSSWCGCKWHREDHVQMDDLTWWWKVWICGYKATNCFKPSVCRWWKQAAFLVWRCLWRNQMVLLGLQITMKLTSVWWVVWVSTAALQSCSIRSTWVPCPPKIIETGPGWSLYNYYNYKIPKALYKGTIEH